jgi:hypothetical protein
VHSRPTIASLDAPMWLRRRWHAAWRENDMKIIRLFVSFVGRVLSGELIWR